MTFAINFWYIAQNASPFLLIALFFAPTDLTPKIVLDQSLPFQAKARSCTQRLGWHAEDETSTICHQMSVFFFPVKSFQTRIPSLK
jgi:hypothetical protein